MARWDALWVNANLATMTRSGRPYGAIENGALAVSDGRIAWVGPEVELPGGGGQAAAAVPEPTSILLLSLGVFAVAARRRNRVAR